MIPCCFFLWDVSYNQHREEGAIVCTPQQVVSCIIYHVIFNAITNLLMAVLQHSLLQQKTLKFWYIKKKLKQWREYMVQVLRGKKMKMLQVFPRENPHYCFKAPAPVAGSAQAQD